MKKLFPLLAVTVVSLGSCMSLQIGYLLPSNVLLTAPNYRIVKNVTGRAEAAYVLGIGGFNHDGLVNEAKQHLLANAVLANNQILINYTMDTKFGFFTPLVYTKEVILTADVVEFTDLKKQESTVSNTIPTTAKPTQRNLDEEDKALLKRFKETKPLTMSTFHNIQEVQPGDYVQYLDIDKVIVFGKVVEIINARKVCVKSYSNVGNPISENVKYADLIKIALP